MVLETNREENRASITLQTARIMKISLFVSLLVHFIILMGLQKAFPVDWVTKPLQTFHVELIRPPVNPLEDGQGAANELAKINSGKDTSKEDTEDTISLETKDKRYSSYAKLIKARLMQHWRYPHKAWENLIEGEVLVLFSLSRNGDLTDMNILKPSRYVILDEETTRTVRNAAPYPPFPGSVTVKKLNIKASFAYRLTSDIEE